MDMIQETIWIRIRLLLGKTSLNNHAWEADLQADLNQQLICTNLSMEVKEKQQTITRVKVTIACILKTHRATKSFTWGRTITLETTGIIINRLINLAEWIPGTMKFSNMLPQTLKVFWATKMSRDLMKLLIITVHHNMGSTLKNQSQPWNQSLPRAKRVDWMDKAMQAQLKPINIVYSLRTRLYHRSQRFLVKSADKHIQLRTT
mgnify:CR=1 FL=1